LFTLQGYSICRSERVSVREKGEEFQRRWKRTPSKVREHDLDDHDTRSCMCLGNYGRTSRRKR
jgi:hypothetical protein